MKVLCVERDKARLKQMRKEARELVPGAHITVCRDPSARRALMISASKMHRRSQNWTFRAIPSEGLP